MLDKDNSLDNLLCLDGEIIVIDEKNGLWVKFEAKEVEVSDNRPHGVKYSLSLHDRNNKRILGFDNAHPISFGGKNKVPSKIINYHWHKDANDSGTPYNFTDAGSLITDFWNEVDKVLKKLEGSF